VSRARALSGEELSPKDETDAQIIGRVLGGDVNAFEGLVNRYRSRVFGIIMKHVPAESAEDVAQESFLEAYRSLGSFSGRSSFGHWLSRIATRCCYHFWRERRGSPTVSVSSLSDNTEEWMDRVLSAGSQESFLMEAAKQEAAEVLTHALGKLSAADRMVLALVHLDGYSVQEAADLLGWSTVAVKVRAHRSRRKLRKIIGDLLQEKGGST
jgi:RNA polymerase sigma-70 factor (ECF subfamily)